MKYLINRKFLVATLFLSGGAICYSQTPGPTIVDGESLYFTYWRQFDLSDFQAGNGPVLDTNITGVDSGTEDPKYREGKPIPLEGSVFQLYVFSSEGSGGTADILDETFAAPFQLTGDINVDRDDSWVKLGENGAKIYRTRSDWDFGLSLNIQGLKKENEFVTFDGREIPFPINLKEARWGESVYRYNDDNFDLALNQIPEFSEPVINIKAEDVENGDMVLYSSNTPSGFNLYSAGGIPDDSTTSGEYHFQLTTVNGGPNATDDPVVYADAVLRVYPQSKGAFVGIDPSGKQNFSAPPENVFADLDNLYPNSFTSFRIFKVNPLDDSYAEEEGINVGVPIDLDDEKPRKLDAFERYPIENIAAAITESGRYRIEIVHVPLADEEGKPTNRPEEILAFSHFNILGEVKVNAGIFTNE